MSESREVRIRPDIRTLQDAYFRAENPDKKPLEKLMRAWKGIKELDPNDDRSFFKIAGYHGEPFRGAGWGNNAYWGGNCNHGNVLFPTWHRVYMHKLEEALQSIEGCEDVMLPFWDETSQDSLDGGIPHILTDEFFELDGQPIDNPLRSFKLTRAITDHLSPVPDANYSKPITYETVRYPLSGLVGTDADREATTAHNALYPDYGTNVGLLNGNVRAWLHQEIVVEGSKYTTGVYKKFVACLNTPHYTPFSNTTSASAYIDDHGLHFVPLESPHNDLHLAIGGFDIPSTQPDGGDFSPIPDANGDMGENDTAAMDPIFYFHHCNIDRVFWLWQKAHGSEDHIDITPEYPGTNTVDNQGPTPGKAPNSWLTVDSTLDPFRLESEDRYYTSKDCLNIRTQLFYDYAPGSLDQEAAAIARGTAGTAAPGQHPVAGEAPRMVVVTGINRTRVRGSFVVSAFAKVDGQKVHLGSEAVLSRWHVDGCANCQTHLMVKAPISLASLSSTVKDEDVSVEVHTRDGKLPHARQVPHGSRSASFSFKVR